MTTECIGRYCPCRRHLDPDMPEWVLDAYMPSRWALETIHGIYVDGRTADQVTDGERAILVAELANLGDKARDAIKERPKCPRCRGLGVIPDFTNWDEYHGEPKPKPCPDCGTKEAS